MPQTSENSLFATSVTNLCDESLKMDKVATAYSHIAYSNVNLLLLIIVTALYTA